MNVKEVKYGHQILGRGKLFFDNRYLGNTPLAKLAVTLAGGPVLAFATDDINLENMLLFVRSIGQPVEGSMRLEAHNPCGPNIDYEFPLVRVRAIATSLKGDTWQCLRFRGEILKKNGVLMRFTYPQQFVVGDAA